MLRHPRLARGAFAALMTSLWLLAPAAHAEEESTMSTGITGLAAGVSSLVYTPLKIAYAGGGVVVGGLSFLVSGGDSLAPSRVTRAAVRGDYVVTPTHLRGQRGIHFVGQ